MRNTIKNPIAIACVFIWIGFVGAISFMEAWLKFRAPGITLPLGLGIGRLVFNALNKIELVLSVIIIADLLFRRLSRFKWGHLFFLVPFLILGNQSIWLLPALDVRAELYIQGSEVPLSNIHFYYIAMELAKITCLFIFGIRLLRQKQIKK